MSREARCVSQRGKVCVTEEASHKKRKVEVEDSQRSQTRRKLLGWLGYRKRQGRRTWESGRRWVEEDHPQVICKPSTLYRSEIAASACVHALKPKPVRAECWGGWHGWGGEKQRGGYGGGWVTSILRKSSSGRPQQNFYGRSELKEMADGFLPFPT